MNWHTTQTGLLIGTLAAVAISSCIALFQFSSDAPWKEILEMWWKMLVLTIPTFAATTAAAMLAWRERRAIKAGESVEWPPLLRAEPITLDSDLVMREPQDSGRHLSLAEAVVQNAWSQASWYYEQGISPTRRAFEEMGVSQTAWNSGRHILTVAKIVDGNEWALRDWETIKTLLNTIHAEPDRVWVRPLEEKTMICLHIDEKAEGKRFTHPTPPQGGLEYNQEPVLRAGSNGS